MKKCGEAEHIYIGVVLDEPAQALHGKRAGLGLAHVEGDLMLHVLPVVDHRVVHMDRIPHDVGQEADRIIVKWNGADDHLSGALVIVPAGCGNRLSIALAAAPAGWWDDLPGAPVDDLPPAGDVVPGVGGQHIPVQALHQGDAQRIRRCGVNGGHEVHLLDLVGVGFGPVVVLAGGVVGGVDLESCVF